MLIHPDFDPIAFSIGPLAVRWYGLMYLVGFAGGFWLGARRIAQGLAPVTRVQLDDLLFLIVLSFIPALKAGQTLVYPLFQLLPGLSITLRPHGFSIILAMVAS